MDEKSAFQQLVERDIQREKKKIEEENTFDKQVKKLTDELAALLIAKNKDYDDSFLKTYQEFGEVAIALRLMDKLNRYKNLIKSDQLVKDESKRDTLADIAGYAFLALVYMDQEG